MNAERLLALFDRVSEAPDAVATLRRFVLDLAVRGKLVEQDPADEPASELLKQIAGEKLRLGYPAQPLFSAPANTPFELPVGWGWTDIGRCCSKTGSGSTPRGGKDVYKTSGIPFLRSQNVYDDGLRLDDVAYIDPQTHQAMSGTKVLPRDLLLNITGGSMGRCCRVPDEFGEANISQHVAIIRPAIEGLEDFLHRLVLSPYFQAFIFEEQTGAGRGGLPKNRMDRIVVALPPLAEQSRIVTRVDELMALCDQLEAACTDRDHRRDRLTRGTLARLNFPDPGQQQADATFFLATLPRLTFRPDQIKHLRQIVLDLAVRGKLVKQDTANEPASELLKRIAEAKGRLVATGEIRKQKPLEAVSAAEHPFALPLGWEWTRLGGIIHLVSGQHLQPSEYSEQPGSGIPYITGPSDFSEKGLQISRFALVRKAVATQGQLLLTVKGSGVGKTTTCDIPEVAISRQLMALSAIAWDPRYLVLVTHLLAEALRQSARSLIPGISREDVDEFVAPIPPLAEQRRIVARVDELMSLCDQLEASLAAADTAGARLLDAILHEALNGPPRAEAA